MELSLQLKTSSHQLNLLYSYTRRPSRQAPPSPTRVTPCCFTHSIRAECRQRADTGGEEGGRHPVSPSSGERVGTGPPPGVRCGRGSPHAFGRSTSRIARRGVPRLPIGSLPPRLRRVSAEIRVQACEILRGHSTSTAASCPSLDLGLAAWTEGRARKPAGSQKRARKRGPWLPKQCA